MRLVHARATSIVVAMKARPYSCPYCKSCVVMRLAMQPQVYAADIMMPLTTMGGNFCARLPAY